MPKIEVIPWGIINYSCVLYDTAFLANCLNPTLGLAKIGIHDFNDSDAIELFRRRWGRHLRSVSRRDGPTRFTTIFHASEDHG